MHRKRRKVVLIFVMMLLIGSLGVGCHREAAPVDEPPLSQSGSTETATPPAIVPVPAPHGEPLRYTLRVRSLTVRDSDGAVLARASSTVPELVDDTGHAGIDAINEHLAEAQQVFLNWVKENAAQVAREDRSSLGAAFVPHFYERWADVHYNDNGIFSVLAEGYSYTGGLQPGSFMNADSFLVESGAKLRLVDVWGLVGDATMGEVYGIIAGQIEAQKANNDFGYHYDYQEYFRQFFDPADFLLTPHGITVFYQPYTIAPHATIPQFLIPFAEWPEAAMSVSPTADRAWERDIHRAAGELLMRNREVAFGMYFLGMLPMARPSVIEYKPGVKLFCPVTDPRFPDLASLERFLRETYAPTQVEALLAEERYVEIEGKLHGDLFKEGGTCYPRDWTDFRFAIRHMAGDTVTLDIIISALYHGDDAPTTEMLSAVLVMVHGHWVLERMVY